MIDYDRWKTTPPEPPAVDPQVEILEYRLQDLESLSDGLAEVVGQLEELSDSLEAAKVFERPGSPQDAQVNDLLQKLYTALCGWRDDADGRYAAVEDKIEGLTHCRECGKFCGATYCSQNCYNASTI